jgi:uncharacterized protein YbjT (DUF2867 family)
MFNRFDDVGQPHNRGRGRLHLKNPQRFAFRPATDQRVQAAARHDVGLGAEDFRREFLDRQEIEEAEAALFAIKEEIDVGIGPGLIARGRAKDIESRYAGLTQIGLARFQSADGIVKPHVTGSCTSPEPYPNLGILGEHPSGSRATGQRLWRRAQFVLSRAAMKTHQIAVLGGSGFIGRYVVKRLAGRGEVLTVGGRYASQATFLRLKGEVGQVGLVNIAIDSEAVLPEFLAGKDALINCVGILREHGAQTFDRVHHGAPARLARLAREAGVARLIHISAIGADPRSTSAYGRSKAAGEQAVKDAFPTATILRPSIVFGPEDDFFNRFAKLATISPFVPLIGGGETRVQPVYVGDVADAVVRALDDPAAAGRTYELGGPKIYTFRALMELMLAEIKRKRWFVDLPYGLAALQARLMAILPSPPLTVDQVEMLKRDNVVSSGALTLATLGIEPNAVEAIIPLYLDRFRKGGWYDRRRAVA